MLGEKWKALSEKQRTPYEAKAAADKKRYEEEKAAYQVRFSSTANRLTRKLTMTGRRGGGRGVRVDIVYPLHHLKLRQSRWHPSTSSDEFSMSPLLF